MSRALLLDTHALLWWVHQPSSLSRRAAAAIESGTVPVFVSAVSAMEIATKTRRGRLEFDTPFAHDFIAQSALEGFEPLPITADHAQLAGSFAAAHADPWDRLLAAQARVERLTLVTNDARLDDFAVETLW